MLEGNQIEWEKLQNDACKMKENYKKEHSYTVCFLHSKCWKEQECVTDKYLWTTERAAWSSPQQGQMCITFSNTMSFIMIFYCMVCADFVTWRTMCWSQEMHWTAQRADTRQGPSVWPTQQWKGCNFNWTCTHTSCIIPVHNFIYIILCLGHYL